jgi:pimeloyl-ACP methyl ester carboxylesterase
MYTLERMHSKKSITVQVFIFSQVPLDYANPGASTAALAVIRFPAQVSRDDSSYKGPILFNPGGPGGSGVDYLLALGSEFAELLGPEYDMVSFDPRGVSRSTPGVSFYETASERIIWNDVPGAIDLSASSDTLSMTWAKNRVTNQLAGQRAMDVLPFMTTDYTARDMKTILEAYGRDKLLYWGIS